MANTTLFFGCPPPFLDERDYPRTGGFLSGRSCGPSPLGEDIYCCLRCPIQSLVYTDAFMSRIRQVNYISFVSLVLCLFVLVSYVVLPASKSHRHYLNVGLLASVIVYHFALIVPIFGEADVCYNDITPRDMYSSGTCAVTGSFLVYGGIGAVIWVFLRVLWTHLRLCWDKSPGRAYMYASIAIGALVPACFLAAVLSATGLSFRMGATCVPKHPNSFADFWGWMLGFAGLSGVVQLATTWYCVMAYLRSLKRRHHLHNHHHTGNSTKSSGTGSRSSEEKAGPRLPQTLPVQDGMVGVPQAMPKLSPFASTMTARSGPFDVASTPASPTKSTSPTKWREVRALLILQWRSLCISIIVMLGIIFFTVVFVIQDAMVTSKSGETGDLPSVQEWTACLALTEGDADECRPYTKDFVLPESTVLACLVVVALTGTELAVLLIRKDMLKAWRDLLRKAWRRCRHGDSDPDLTLTSLAAMPYPERMPSPQPGGLRPVPHVPSRLQPITEAVTTSNPQDQRQQSSDTGPEAGTRTSFMKRMSWRKSAFMERLNWPLPAEGLQQHQDIDHEVSERANAAADNDTNDGNEKDIESATDEKQAQRSFWEDEETNGTGVVVDPRAWRGGLAMNPVNGPPVSRQNSVAQRASESNPPAG